MSASGSNSAKPLASEIGRDKPVVTIPQADKRYAVDQTRDIDTDSSPQIRPGVYGSDMGDSVVCIGCVPFLCRKCKKIGFRGQYPDNGWKSPDISCSGLRNRQYCLEVLPGRALSSLHRRSRPP